MNPGSRTLAATVLAAGLLTTACGGSSNPGTASSATGSPTPASTVAAADLPALVPTPAQATVTKGPDGIADGGIHLHFQADGAPAEVMAAYEKALRDKGWQVTTIITSGGSGGGGATYTGTHGEAYGVFDGGGFNTTTYLDVCAWPTKPAEPNCSRSQR